VTHPTDTPILKVDGAAKAYSGRRAVAPLSLSISEGERVAVLGPSGSGKTTLLHLMAGIIRPDSGSIELGGRSISDLGPGREAAGLVGVIHQQYDLVPHLSVAHNVLAGRLGAWGVLRSLWSLISPQDLGLAENALERVGLLDRLYERTSRLSGGEQQRVAIARLLVQDPRVIVADEPVASLDPARARDLMILLSGVATDTGKTLISSLHSTELATEFFDRAIGLRDGAVVFDIPVASLNKAALDDLYLLEPAG
jgi:phosphonate transport system ATP-binding protein